MEPIISARLSNFRDCVVVERGDGNAVWLVDVDGRLKCSSMQVADDLIRRERLKVVTQAELRKAAMAFTQMLDWTALDRKPTGTDDRDVLTAKKVARLQERYRDDEGGWHWWTRFSIANSESVCADLLCMLNELTKGKAYLDATDKRTQWLEILRQAIAEQAIFDLQALRAAIWRKVSDE